jgi:hypothetical protein
MSSRRQGPKTACPGDPVQRPALPLAEAAAISKADADAICGGWTQAAEQLALLRYHANDNVQRLLLEPEYNGVFCTF